ncbi:PLP-dependent transferase [Schizophyllum commune H4-8]|uniref:Dethiobiotin synthase n=1 Tax=Schizophyllum commune (strain H4-8 / FGSC 9210) TaxID=578458 RepID=D8Q596_SCHCM|nr:PLP-dependent transferase [Schizophyllum commune H4-8]KAI5892279.1 PLP-dependent transferase [Schizophyllum commune H4-8]
MSSLFKHLRVHQIFGANTDVGKTLLTTALVRASAARGHDVFYLKPVSTGSMNEADDGHIQRFTSSVKSKVHADCLYRYTEPVSPHLAVKLDQKDAQNVSGAPADGTVVNAIAEHIKTCASRAHKLAGNPLAHMYVETAGGVHSPSLSGTTQLDLYRPLFLPTILVGDSKLGGISSTISSFESLHLRGYTVDAILLFREGYYRNWEYLKSYFSERDIPVFALDKPPDLHPDPTQNFARTDKYYQSVTSADGADSIASILDHLDSRHAQRQTELYSMPRRALDTIWWPFVQHGLIAGEKDINVIDSAHRDFFSVHRPTSDPSASALQPQFDGSASWWTQALGHAHPAVALAAAHAAGRYGHVMFPSAVHAPVLELAERLVQGPGAGWADYAFFSDNGSTGMEVALKMALRAYAVRHELRGTEEAKKLGILGLKGSYHGDTLGAMDACEDGGVYSCEWHNARGVWLEPPTVGIREGAVYVRVPGAVVGKDADELVRADSLSRVYDVEYRMQTTLAKSYEAHIRKVLGNIERDDTQLGALVLEPLVMGAGGMIFVDPLFQRVLIDVVRGRGSSRSPSSSTVSSTSTANSSWTGMPVIFDEVFAGLHRLGLESAAPLLGVTPDIAVYAKILTGGLLPLAATLASRDIYNAFLSDSKADALLHGHSYSAHAVGCAVANEALNQIARLEKEGTWDSARARWAPTTTEEARVWSLWDPTFVKALSKHDKIAEVMTLGTVLAVKVKTEQGGYVSHSAQELLKGLGNVERGEGGLSSAPGGAPFSIHFRTLGDVAYLMLSLNTEDKVVREVEDRVWQAIAAA